MQVKLIDYARDPLEKLYAAFRTCYSSDSPIEVWEKIRTEKISHERVREFIGERLKTGHASPLEQIVFWFAIAGVSRSLSHQFVRHRIGISFEQQSQRYVKFKQDRLAFVMPESWRRAGMEEEFAGLLERTSELYGRALKAGIPAEDARFVLPNAAPTNFHVMVNFAEMLHICDLRLCVRAQWEIRRMVAMMRAEIKHVLPEIAVSYSPSAARTGWAIATSRSRTGRNARWVGCARTSPASSSCTNVTAPARPRRWAKPNSARSKRRNFSSQFAFPATAALANASGAIGNPRMYFVDRK